MKPTFFKLTTVAILVAGLAGCSGEKSAEEHLVSGQQAIAEQNIEQAIIHYKNAVRLAPKDATMRLSLGKAYVQLGDYLGAEKELKKSGRPFKLVEKTFHDVDHPIHFPEGAYLKAGYYRLN